MTDDAPIGNESIKQAGLQGIGSQTVSRLATAGVTTVADLAAADIDNLSSELADHFPQWKSETLRHRVAQWVALAQERETTTTTQTRGHVFLLTLWTDASQHPVRSRFEYRSTSEPNTEKAPRETAGWSPLAFARFVERTAGLVEAKELSEERIDRSEIVEWSQHRIAGRLVHGGEAVSVEAAIPTEDLAVAGTPLRWRVAGQLVPFGEKAAVRLGRLAGTGQSGDVIDLLFAARPVSAGLYRAWFDLSLSPPVDAEVFGGLLEASSQ